MRYLSVVAIAMCGAFPHSASARPEVIDKSVAPTVLHLGLSSDDYPAAAQQKHGGIRLLLAIDTFGKIYRCSVTVSSGVPELDTQTCAILVRGRTFNAAKDQMGVAVPSEDSAGVSWGVPSRSPYDGIIYVDSLPNGKSSISLVIRQVISADGKVEICAIDRSSGINAIDRQACQLISGIFPERSLKDIDGKPVRGLRRSIVAFIADKNGGEGKQP